jgi:HSP20 family molecular chaperone IbpA
MYKSNLDNLIDKLFDTNLPSHSWKTIASSERKEVDYVYHIEDNQIHLSVDVVGHDPKNISLEATIDQIIIKSAKPDTACSLVQDIDFSFKLNKDYDGTKSEAKFDNGLLVITISKKEETKTKKLSINIR